MEEENTQLAHPAVNRRSDTRHQNMMTVDYERHGFLNFSLYESVQACPSKDLNKE
jgi:hypothetical protein